MHALEAGALNHQGDSRCTPSGIASDSAFLQVDRPGEPAGSSLVLEVTGTAPQNPLVSLPARYDAWRAAHPCPAAPAAGVNGDAGLDPGDPIAANCCAASDNHASLLWALLVVIVLRRPSRLDSRPFPV
jgi:hypothetical protein